MRYKTNVHLRCHEKPYDKSKDDEDHDDENDNDDDDDHEKSNKDEDDDDDKKKDEEEKRGKFDNIAFYKTSKSGELSKVEYDSKKYIFNEKKSLLTIKSIRNNLIDIFCKFYISTFIYSYRKR